MPTKLRGPALDVCPQCGEAMKWYPQHWNRSADCDYPDLITPELHQIIRGILLSDGSLEGSERAKLRVETTTKILAEWLYDQLGEIAGGLRKHRRENPRSDIYRVSSLTHPELNPYREWYVGSQKRIPDPECLNERGMTVFYALDGSLNWGQEGQRPRITFKAVDDEYRADLARMLRSYDSFLTVRVASDHVSLSASDTVRFIESLVEPVPGVRYKWELSRTEYKQKRSQERHHINHSAQKGRLDHGTVDSCPSCERSTIYERKQTDDWRCQHCGEEFVNPITRKKTIGAGAELTVDVRDKALQLAAEDIGEPITIRGYDQWRDGDVTVPTSQSIKRKWGWSDACLAAGVQPAQFLDDATYSDFLAALYRIYTDTGSWPKSNEYPESRTAKEPARSLPYKDDTAPNSWGEYIEDAKHRFL